MNYRFSNLASRLREMISSHPEASCDSPLQNFAGVALELFALQFASNAPYRRLCEARQAVPGRVNGWTEIPAMPTAAFKEFELSCLPAQERTTVFHSSGTTAQNRSRHFHSTESLRLYETSLWTWFCMHLLADKDGDAESQIEVVALTPPPFTAPNSSLVHMFDCIRRKMGSQESAFVGKAVADGGWTLDFEATLAALNSKRQTRNPKLVLGTAFSFVHLLDELAKRGLQIALPPGSRAMETGGYKGHSRSMAKSELHALITRLLGIPASHIICEYGMSELSSQAYDWKAPGLRTSPETRNFHFPPWARAQVISPETGREVADGETGLLRIFDLSNVWSVMAIQTEDLAIRRGNGFELLGRAEFSEPRGCSLTALDSCFQ